MAYPLLSPVLIVMLGVFGFSMTLLYDVLQLYPGRFRTGRSIVSVLGMIGVVAATGGVFLLSPLPGLPWWVLVIAGCALVFSTVKLWWTVVGEIPHSAIRDGNERTVIESGSYAVVRHPGFLWYLAILLIVVLVYRSTIVTMVGGALVLMDLIVVLVEDRVLFPRLFGGYRDYRRRVPMLIPRVRL